MTKTSLETTIQDKAKLTFLDGQSLHGSSPALSRAAAIRKVTGQVFVCGLCRVLSFAVVGDHRVGR